MVIYAELYALLLKQEIMNSVNRPDLQILTALSVCAGHYGKLYCYPSQDKILSWLARQGRRMSRRTLNRHMRALERQGWIKRRRRHHNDKVRGFVFRSTLYELTRRSMRWLAGLVAAVGMAAKRAGSFFGRSRVPDSAQYSYHKVITPGAVTQKTGEPPPGKDKKELADHGEPWDKKKAAAKPHLADLRRVLA